MAPWLFVFAAGGSVLALLSSCTEDVGSGPIEPQREASVGDGPAATETSVPDGGGDARTDVAPEAAPDAVGDAALDSLPPGTVVVTDLDEHMFKIANGGADHCTTAEGHDYCAGSCNGSCAGSDAMSTYSVETGVLDPATLAATSTGVEVSGPTTDTLEWVKVDPAAKGTGLYKSYTHFVWEFDFYPTATTDVQAYEFDAFYGAGGYWLMMGSQCDLASGNWNGWNQATGHWIPSSIDGCGSFFHVNAWNHVVIRLHRDPGTVSSSTRYYYDDLEVNGVSHSWGLPGFMGSDNDWGDVVGVQVQQDLKASFSGTLKTYYQAFTLEISP